MSKTELKLLEVFVLLQEVFGGSVDVHLRVIEKKIYLIGCQKVNEESLLTGFVQDLEDLEPDDSSGSLPQKKSLKGYFG